MCVWNGWKYFLFVAVFHFPRATEERLIEICIDIYTENEYEKTEMNSDYIKPPRLKNNAIFVRSDMVMMASCWKQIMSLCILDLFQKTGVILLTCIYIFYRYYFQTQNYLQLLSDASEKQANTKKQYVVHTRKQTVILSQWPKHKAVYVDSFYISSLIIMRRQSCRCPVDVQCLGKHQIILVSGNVRQNYAN